MAVMIHVKHRLQSTGSLPLEQKMEGFIFDDHRRGPRGYLARVVLKDTSPSVASLADWLQHGSDV